MKNYLYILILLLTLNCTAQSDTLESSKYYPAKEVFEEKYKEQNYYRYPKSKIIQIDNKVFIDVVKSIEFNTDLDEKYKLIILNGLLDPNKIDGSYNIKICCIEELKLLNPNPQTKRFLFWAEPKPINDSFPKRINPNEYYFELKNKDADENTSFKDFINGARMSFLIFGTIVI